MSSTTGPGPAQSRAWQLQGQGQPPHQSRAEGILTERAVEPRLAADAVGEPAVRAADGDVHDEVERLVKRRREARVDPRVRRRDRLAAVGDERREVAAGEEGLVEGDVEHVVQARVDVDAQELVRPLERVRVEALVVRRPALVPPAERLRDAVEPGEGAPVERAADVVDAPAGGCQKEEAEKMGTETY
jgi:hypothetical protein